MAVARPNISVPARLQLSDESANLAQDGILNSLALAEDALSRVALPAWSSSKRYREGELVYLDNVLWRANTALEASTVFADDIAAWDAVAVGYPLALGTERVIGRGWVSNAPVYDQAYRVTLASAPGTTTAPHGISGLDITGWGEICGISNDTTTFFYPYSPYAPSGSSGGVRCRIDVTNINMQHSNTVHDNAVCHVVLRYQRT